MNDVQVARVAQVDMVRMDTWQNPRYDVESDLANEKTYVLGICATIAVIAVLWIAAMLFLWPEDKMARLRFPVSTAGTTPELPAFGTDLTGFEEFTVGTKGATWAAFSEGTRVSRRTTAVSQATGAATILEYGDGTYD